MPATAPVLPSAPPAPVELVTVQIASPVRASHSRPVTIGRPALTLSPLPPSQASAEEELRFARFFLGFWTMQATGTPPVLSSRLIAFVMQGSIYCGAFLRCVTSLAIAHNQQNGFTTAKQKSACYSAPSCGSRGSLVCCGGCKDNQQQLLLLPWLCSCSCRTPLCASCGPPSACLFASEKADATAAHYSLLAKPSKHNQPAQQTVNCKLELRQRLKH